MKYSKYPDIRASWNIHASKYSKILSIQISRYHQISVHLSKYANILNIQISGWHQISGWLSNNSCSFSSTQSSNIQIYLQNYNIAAQYFNHQTNLRKKVCIQIVCKYPKIQTLKYVKVQNIQMIKYWKEKIAKYGRYLIKYRNN